jgi:hypothetical protein
MAAKQLNFAEFLIIGFSFIGVAMNGFWERVAFAFRCFFSILFHAEIPNDIAQKLVKLAAPVPQSGDSHGCTFRLSSEGS